MRHQNLHQIHWDWRLAELPPLSDDVREVVSRSASEQAAAAQEATGTGTADEEGVAMRWPCSVARSPNCGQGHKTADDSVAGSGRACLARPRSCGPLCQKGSRSLCSFCLEMQRVLMTVSS